MVGDEGLDLRTGEGEADTGVVGFTLQAGKLEYTPYGVEDGIVGAASS